MKASLKFREDQKPLFRGKVPLSILGLPFQSGFAAGDSKELSLSLATLFDTGPALRLSYSPNHHSNPLSLVVKTGIGHFGSPIDAPMTLSAEFNLAGAEASSTHPGTGASSVHILNPHVSQTKGRKKGKEVIHGSGRIKSSVEIATKKRKRKCRCCNQMVRHDTRTCPLNPNSRKKHVESTEDDEEDREMGEDVDSSDD
ncbi:hypothetical protein Dimus_029660 [Dionaea muscipula]